jgi:hypothetical protein
MPIDFRWGKIREDYSESSRKKWNWIWFHHGKEWDQRCLAWLVHFSVWETLKTVRRDSASADIDSASEKRIEFLFQHLGILDGKFGTLLTLNGLLVIAPGYLFAHMGDLQLLGLAAWQITLVWIAVALFGACWSANVLLCLTAFRRLVWGNLGRDLYDPTHSWTAIQPCLGNSKEIAKAEEKFVELLIMILADRSNRFRLAMSIQILMATVLIALVFGGLAVWVNLRMHLVG